MKGTKEHVVPMGVMEALQHAWADVADNASACVSLQVRGGSVIAAISDNVHLESETVIGRTTR